MPLFGKKKAVEVDMTRLPRHIAIIMDGNGRWAKRRGLPRTVGHAAGAETFRSIGTYCRELGIEYLTVYAFSTENWKRPAEEVSAIMELLKKYLVEALEEMEKEKVRLCSAARCFTQCCHPRAQHLLRPFGRHGSALKRSDHARINQRARVPRYGNRSAYACA